MHRLIKLIVLGTASMLVALLSQGCVTSKKYRLAKSETTPRELGWSIASAEASLTLKNLVVFKGPGSWKREARWDEYVIQLTNRGDYPVIFESAGLVDLLQVTQFPGDDPWKLEKLSYTNWDKYGKSGLKLLAGAGIVTLYVGAVVSTATAGLLAGGATSGGAVALLDVVPVFAAVDITAVAIMNHQNKGKVQAEFQRRRISFPLTVPAGASVTGSLFFPMTPGPQRLVLTGHSGDRAVALVLELKLLAPLHLKPADNRVP